MTSTASRMRILFINAFGRPSASTAVRVLRFLTSMEALGIKASIIHWQSPLRVKIHLLRTKDRKRFPWLIRGVLRAAEFLAYIMNRMLLVPRYNRLASSSDAVVLHWVVPPKVDLKIIFRRARRVIFDFDDGVHLLHPKETEWLVRRSWHVIAGSHALYDYARALNPRTTLIPSSVDVSRFNRPRSASDAAVRVGWIGGPSTLNYLHLMTDVMRGLVQRGLRPKIFIAGTDGQNNLLPDFGALPVQIIDHYCDADVPDLVRQFDIGIMPLHHGPWEVCKCAMKAIVYMAGRVPAVCSRVGENTHVIEDGVNGFLADSTEEWVDKIETLMLDADLRKRMGDAGRQTVEASYSTDVCHELMRSRIWNPLQEEISRGQ